MYSNLQQQTIICHVCTQGPLALFRKTFLACIFKQYVANIFRLLDIFQTYFCYCIYCLIFFIIFIWRIAFFVRLVTQYFACLNVESWFLDMLGLHCASSYFNVIFASISLALHWHRTCLALLLCSLSCFQIEWASLSVQN